MTNVLASGFGGASGAGGGAATGAGASSCMTNVFESACAAGATGATGGAGGAASGGAGTGASCANSIIVRARSGMAIFPASPGGTRAGPGTAVPPSVASTGEDVGGAGAGSVAGPTSVTAPHWPQNFARSGSSFPHWGQARAAIRVAETIVVLPPARASASPKEQARARIECCTNFVLVLASGRGTLFVDDFSAATWRARRRATSGAQARG